MEKLKDKAFYPSVFNVNKDIKYVKLYDAEEIIKEKEEGAELKAWSAYGKRIRGYQKEIQTLKDEVKKIQRRCNRGIESGNHIWHICNDLTKDK